MFKFLSGMFLMIGAMVGGGILAIPIVSAKFGFLTALILVISSWLLMTKTGLIILDLSLSCPEKYNSYYSIVGKFLGNQIQKITVFLFLWLLYFALSSYISGCASLIMGNINAPPSAYLYFIISLLLVSILGSLVIISAKIIVRINTLLVGLKLGLLFAIILLAPSMHSVLAYKTSLFSYQAGIVSFTLIIINAFGFQFIIPSMVSYYGRDNKAIFKWMLFASTTTVLILYLSWLYTIYSIIPLEGKHGLISIFQSPNQLLAFNNSLSYFLNSTWIINLLSFFQIVALFGSFFCVSLGVFDFLVDIFKPKKRFYMGLLTFLPALFLTVLSQNMYVYAMSAAGYIAIALEIIIPFWAQRTRYKGKNLIQEELAV